MNTEPIEKDVIIIGGGQSGLAIAYFLKREGIDFLILDLATEAGGAWTHAWKSLKLFSPKEYSSLPGWMMPPTKGSYPTREEIIKYLIEYEHRYGFEVKRPIKVESVLKDGSKFVIKTSQGDFSSRALVCATGNWSNPFIPSYSGREEFKGIQLHSAHYQSPEPFTGRRVLIVGGGNSAAQILAEVSQVAKTFWVTKDPPEFLPDDVDGRYLFNLATKKYQAMLRGEEFDEAYNLAKIVMVDSVRDARDRGVLQAEPPFEKITGESIVWSSGREEKIDAIIWCTGFRPNLSYLTDLQILTPDGKVETVDSRSVAQPNLWFIGFGDWTGFAAATLIGVQRWAKKAALEIKATLS